MCSEDLFASMISSEMPGELIQTVPPLGQVYVSLEALDSPEADTSALYDLLHLLLLSEVARRRFTGTGITILLNEAQDLTAARLRRTRTVDLARRQRDLIFKITENLGVPDSRVFFLSEVETEDEWHKLYTAYEDRARDAGSVLLLKMALCIEYVRSRTNLSVKVGLLTQKGSKLRFDDAAVDSLYRSLFPDVNDLQFFYGRSVGVKTSDAAAPVWLAPPTVVIGAWESLTGTTLGGRTAGEKFKNLTRCFSR